MGIFVDPNAGGRHDFGSKNATLSPTDDFFLSFFFPMFWTVES